MSFLRVHTYKGYATQSLRNVAVTSPSMFWIQRGEKRLASGIVVDEQQLLLVPARSRLTFANLPRQGEFVAQQLSLLAPVKPGLLAASAEHEFAPPLLTVDASLRHLLEFSMAPHSEAVQQSLLALWQQSLAERGALQYLYSAATASVSEQLLQWFQANPAAEHSLVVYAQRLAMGRATLIRKLHAEGCSFRQLLVDCRMNHALALMQQGHSTLMLAPACGYDSESRFRQRFVAHFGMTPQAYQQTLQPTR